jgi:hypothetical protein
MARIEADREDLIREATALVDRLELDVDGFDDVVTAGFRRNGALSLFFGQDLVYQFDPEGRLRRAFIAGTLYRSQHSTLAQLTRCRTSDETILQRSDLTHIQLADFHDRMKKTLSDLSEQLTSGSVVVRRSVTSTQDTLQRLKDAVRQVLDPVADWLSPQIRLRR